MEEDKKNHFNLNGAPTYSASPLGEVAHVEPIQYESEEELLALLSSGSASLKYFLGLIDKVKASEAPIIGQGAYKKVFGVDDKAVSFIKKEYYKSSLQFLLKKFNNEQRVLNGLAECGVNVPTSYCTYFDKEEGCKLMDFYHIDERAPGKCLLYYNSNSDNFRRFMESSLVDNSGTSANSSPLSEDDLFRSYCLKYNLQMAQHRALTGQKFLPKLFRDYVALASLELLGDCHSENIHYSSKSGYWFMDLDMKNNLSIFQSTSIPKYLGEYMISTLSDSNFYLIERLIQSIGVENIDHIGGPAGAFAQYVYNGIILQQLENALINNYPSDLEEPEDSLPAVKHTRDITIKNRFFNYRAKSKKVISTLIPFETTCMLEQAIRENNTSLLDEYRDLFDLPYDYDFASELDLPILQQAIENTITQKDSEISPMIGEETIAKIDDSNNITFEME